MYVKKEKFKLERSGAINGKAMKNQVKKKDSYEFAHRQQKLFSAEPKNILDESFQLAIRHESE